MPTYQVTDSETGRKYKLTGESPPTEQELEQIFADAPRETTGIDNLKKGLENHPVSVGLDVARNLASGAVAQPLSGLAGGAAALNPFAGEGAGARTQETVQKALTSDLKTDGGQALLRKLSELIQGGLDTEVPKLETGTRGLEDFGKTPREENKVTFGEALDAPAEAAFQKFGPLAGASVKALQAGAAEALGLKGVGAFKPRAKSNLSPDIAKAITQAAPDINVLKSASTSAYAQLDELGIKIKPNVYDRFADRLRIRLAREGIDRDLTPKATAALNRVLEAKGSPKSPSELDTLRKIAGDAAKSIDPADARLGAIMVDSLDEAIDQASKTIGGKFEKARELYSRVKKSEAITDMIENASHTASGMENGLRIEARKLLKNKKKRRGFTEDQLDALRKIEQGTSAANTAKFLGKFGISEGQATSMLGASIGMGGGGALGAAFGGPPGAAVGAITVPALGQFAKKTAQRITLNNTKYADALTRAGRNGKEITKAYFDNTPVNQRNVSDLTDLLLEADLSSIKPTNKIAIDAVFFADELIKKAASASLLTTEQEQ
jgi:hypothetical protein